MTQICPACGTENQDEAQVCTHCQSPLQSFAFQDKGDYSFCIDLVSGRMTHTGRMREANQDSMLVIECNRVSNSVALPIGVYAVADGMGGQAAGEVASKAVIDFIAQKAQTEAVLPYLTSGAVPFTDPTSWMSEMTHATNHAVYGLRQELQNDMGTTLVWALVLEDIAYIANVGDSRAYILSQAGIRQITKDHSLVGELVAGGQITSEQARSHPYRNVVYRTMGYTPEVEVDVFVESLEVGERLLLCSDGLSSMLNDQALWRAAMSSDNLSQACVHLIQEANEAGGQDNITVILIELTAMSGDNR